MIFTFTEPRDVLQGRLKYGNGTETTYNYASSAFTSLSLDYLNKSSLYASSVDGKATQGGFMTTLVDRDYQYSNLGMVSSLSKGVHTSLAAGVTALDYSFSYDDKGRLSGSTLAAGGSNIYEMTMGYNAAGGITSKDSDRPGGHPLVDPNLDYELSYTYNPSKPHQLLSVSDAGPNGGLTNFTYDGVGNLINMSGPTGTEELIWNELQQLSGVKNGSGIHHYVYDHSGERIMKSSINRSSVQVNDQTIDDIQYLEPYTLYVNPYFVVTSFQNGDRASKHYYMNTQRVATDISINYQGPPPPAAPGAQGTHNGTQAAPIGLSTSLEQDINQVLHQFGAGEISGALSEDGIAIETYYPKAATESESTNRILYWYHPDYLGSVDLVTDRNGVAYEFFLYTPWGEDMYHYNAGQSSFTSPYRFNGKEKDPETGYHYYGARYYQSKFSVWMSVDPLAHETLEPYVYTGNNPVMLVDPDGMSSINGGPGGPPKKTNQSNSHMMVLSNDATSASIQILRFNNEGKLETSQQQFDFQLTNEDRLVVKKQVNVGYGQLSVDVDADDEINAVNIGPLSLEQSQSNGGVSVKLNINFEPFIVLKEVHRTFDVPVTIEGTNTQVDKTYVEKYYKVKFMGFGTEQTEIVDAATQQNVTPLYERDSFGIKINATPSTGPSPFNASETVDIEVRGRWTIVEKN